MQAALKVVGWWCALALVATCDSKPACSDEDGDGVTTCGGDCDDGDALSYPGAFELCGGAVDTNCDGQIEDVCAANYVSATTGDDTNPGTQARPLRTIGAGLAAAAATGAPWSVRVGQGTYAEKVTLVEGIELDGGYACTAASCTWARDPAAYGATIADQDFQGVLAGPGITPATLVRGFTIVGKDGAPELPGSAAMTIAGGSPTVRGNTIIGGTVTLAPPVIHTFPTATSIGIELRTTGTTPARIEDNDISGGVAFGLSGTSVAISFHSDYQVLATIDANVLRGGPASYSIGVRERGAAPGTVISNNDVVMGNASLGSAGIDFLSTIEIDRNRINVDPGTVGTCTPPSYGWCAGIASYYDASTATITNNIVYGPKGPRSAAVYLEDGGSVVGDVIGHLILNGNYLNGGGDGLNASGGSRSQSAAVVVARDPSGGACPNCDGVVAKIRNNILDGGLNLDRFGILEGPRAGVTVSAEALEANDLWFAALPDRIDVLYRQVANGGAVTDITTLAALNAMTLPPASLNLWADPQLDATWHLTAGSPCIDTGVSTEAPAFDLDGDARPSHGLFDIGADEAP